MSRFALLCVLSYAFAVFAANNVETISNYHGVSTFECIGLYCDYVGDDNGNSVCSLAYKETASSEWKTGHPLWTDVEEKQYRGSIVNLRPNTRYDIKLTIYDVDGAPLPVTFQNTTWNETFPIGKTINVSNQSTTLNVSQSGNPQGYTLYTPSPGQQGVIDVNNTQNYCVNVNADYVIIRGLKVTGAKVYGVYININRHDIVIENCEVTNWGPSGVGNFDFEQSTGIRSYGGSYRVIAQNNIIHTPRGGSWYWDQNPAHPHPWGPQPFAFTESLGNHVIRYNYCYSESLHYFNDGIGGEDNGGVGPLGKDSDVYGNHVTHCWDDGLELEGELVNCRIWGNVIHKSFCGISTAHVSSGIHGPSYFWRNVITDSRKNYSSVGDGAAFKVGGPHGPLYLYNNTIVDKFSYQNIILRGPADGVGGSGYIAQNFTCKNNILHANSPIAGYVSSEPTNFFDYNCYLMNPSGLPPSWEQHRVIGMPSYDTTQGYFQFFLNAGHNALDKGCVIPNFNDNFVGAGPDIGAFERDGDTLRFGVQASLPTEIAGDSKTMLKVLPYSINCWPNPFLNTTKIDLGVMGEKSEQIEIYSLSGRLLKRLPLHAAIAVWDGTDAYGKSVADGQYIIRALSSGQTLEKMIIKVK